MSYQVFTSDFFISFSSKWNLWKHVLGDTASTDLESAQCLTLAELPLFAGDKQMN